MKKYQIYAEGYVATGESGAAHWVGEAEGKNFKEACYNLLKDKRTYNAERNTLWGCHLFDNLWAAQRSFG